MALGTTLKIAFDGNAVKRGLSGMKRDMASVAKVAAGIGLAVGAIAGGLIYAAKKALDFGLAINKVGEESNTANARVHSIIKTIGLFGDESQNVGNRLTALADKTARAVGLDEKSIKLTQAKMLTFKGLAASANVVGGAFDRATMAAIDMAAAGFGTAESNAVQLGKALEDPTKGLTALARSGITFTASQKLAIVEMIKSNKMLEAQDTILKAIEGQVKNTAAATANGSDRIGVGMEQIKRSFAMGFAGAFDSVPGQLDGVIEKAIERMAPIGRSVGDAIAEAIAGDTARLSAIGEVIGDVISAGLKVGLEEGAKRAFAAFFRLNEGIAESVGMGKMSFAGDIAKYFENAQEGIGGRLSDEMEQRGIQRRIAAIQSGEVGGRVRMDGGLFEPTNESLSDLPDLYKNGQAYRLIERIEEHLRPTP